jgi:hypothetical protein
MKKYLITTLAALVAVVTVQAQKEFKLTKSTGKLVINTPGVMVEGYAGTEIIFSSNRDRDDKDERAEGLRPISGSGFEDNTNGLGINVADKGATVEVNMVSQKERTTKIRVPKGMSVSYNFNRVQHGNAEFKDIEGELEVSVLHNRVRIENCTGPMSVKSVHGGIDAKLPDNIKGPISLISAHGYVDVSMSPATKANIKLNTNFGEIFAAQDFKIEFDKGNSEMLQYGSKVRGKLNGGGTDITFSSDHGKIYLRKN